MVVKKRNLLKEEKKEEVNEKNFICGYFISWKILHYEFFLEWWIKCVRESAHILLLGFYSTKMISENCAEGEFLC